MAVSFEDMVSYFTETIVETKEDTRLNSILRLTLKAFKLSEEDFKSHFEKNDEIFHLVVSTVLHETGVKKTSHAHYTGVIVWLASKFRLSRKVLVGVALTSNDSNYEKVKTGEHSVLPCYSAVIINDTTYGISDLLSEDKKLELLDMMEVEV